MKDFSKRGFRIAESAREVKLAYTGFLLFALVGYVTLGVIGLVRVGPGYQQIVAHYLGSEMDEAAFPRSFGQMIEEAHFHAFIEGVILLILAHLFVATSVRRRVKYGVILLAFGSTLADLACPWLIRYAAAGFAWLQIASWIGIQISALLLIGVPLYEMWMKGGTR